VQVDLRSRLTYQVDDPGAEPVDLDRVLARFLLTHVHATKNRFSTGRTVVGSSPPATVLFSTTGESER
jgi:hypothetical protein